MNKLTLFISALLFVILNVSQAWALPNCVGSFSTSKWKNCFGTYNWDNGDKYVGEFKDGSFHGQGTHTSADGDKYVGEFKDDLFHGQGTMIFGPDSEWAGDKYVGEYKDNERNGQGTYTYANGNKYVGEFRNGGYSGQGTITFGPESEWAGDKYVGEFKDGKYDGQGIYFFTNGSKWVGTWENDNLNGYAITYKSDGSINQEGIFKDDVFQYAQKKSKLDEYKDFCKEIGFTPKTESFGNCVLKLMDRD